jgi:hypothetical protein
VRGAAVREIGVPHERVAGARPELHAAQTPRARLLVQERQVRVVVGMVGRHPLVDAVPEVFLDAMAAAVVLELARAGPHVLQRDPASDELHRRMHLHVCRVLVHRLLRAEPEVEALERHRVAFEEAPQEREDGRRERERAARSRAGP